ncbi:type VI secretion system ATPase TssH [Desulfonauticus submarinus]
MQHDLRKIVNKFNSTAAEVLQNAAGLCVSRTNYEIAVEHYLLKAIENIGGDVQLILHHFGVNTGEIQAKILDALEDFKAGNTGKPIFSPLLVDLFESSWLVTSIDLGLNRISTGSIFLTFLKKPTYFGAGSYIDVLVEKIDIRELEENFWNILKNSNEYQKVAREQAGGAPVAEGGFVEKYCQDFTAKAKEGKIDPVFGREDEINQIIDVLARRRKNNPILVGEPGVGKTAVIEGLALRIVEGDVPEMLRNVRLLGLDMGSLEAGASVKGEFEKRLKGVLDEIKASEQSTILFIDEAHTLIGAGGSAGSSDAANLLKPALARGEIKACAATTWSEYKKYFEKDPALARRFQLIKLDEPDVKTAIMILRGLKSFYEETHKVTVLDDAIVASAEYADRYITGRFLPDKAIDVLDTACARVKINLSSKPAKLNALEKELQSLQRKQKGIERDKLHGRVIDEEDYNNTLKSIEVIQKDIEELRNKWLQEKEIVEKLLDLRSKLQEVEDRESIQKEIKELEENLQELHQGDPLIRYEVDVDVVGQVISDWTGVPLGKIKRDETENILKLEEKLRERIKGQDHALTMITKVIKAAKSGVKPPTQPMGVFLLVGPSGVGKTETGLALADLLFGGEQHVVTINMSEFQEKHTVSRLIGSPPGYVGYGEGGMLTEAVRQRPYTVVLLDEVEKAHPSVMNLFYQVFDKGILTDGEGKEISFKDTVILLTSNLGTDIIQEMTKEEEKPPADAVIQAIRPLLSKHFQPALLARMTVIPYFSLDKTILREIVILKLNKMSDTVYNNNRIKIDYTPEVVDKITERCSEVETGARNIDYILQGNIMPKIADKILETMTEEKEINKLQLTVKEDGFEVIE